MLKRSLPKISGKNGRESSLDGLDTSVNLTGDSHILLSELDLGGKSGLGIVVEEKQTV